MEQSNRRTDAANSLYPSLWTPQEVNRTRINRSSMISMTRTRSNTAYMPQPQNINGPHLSHVVPTEKNRSRSSSWPAKPHLANPSTPAGRTRSGSRSSPKKLESPSGRKKRKRLNPQRRSFYKALHNDFPAIAEALREARQGNCAVDSLRSRDIFFTLIQARPPQDPTNLNVRRYNNMVFIWDPNVHSWLQVPGDGKDSVPPDMESPSGKTIVSPEPSYFQAFQAPASTQFPDIGCYTYEGSFLSDNSTSEDEEYAQEMSNNLHDFLPRNIIDDVL